jgi:hypothetical protein
MHVILFTGTTDFDSGPYRTLGAYKVANIIERCGWGVNLIDNTPWYVRHYAEELELFVRELTTRDTLFAFSLTFMRQSRAIDPFIIDFMQKLKQIFPRNKILIGGSHSEMSSLHDMVDHEINGLSEVSLVEFLNQQNPTKRNQTVDPKAESYDFHDEIYRFNTNYNINENETLPLEVSRGCKFKCAFCAYQLIGRKGIPKWHKHQDRVYEELMHNWENFGTTKYNITCDTFNETTEKLEKIHEILQRLPFKIEFSCYLRLELLQRFPEQVELLRDMGLAGAFFGIETFNDKSRKAIGKGAASSRVIDTLEKLKAGPFADVLVQTAMMIGLPFDTEKTMRGWLDMMLDDAFPVDSVSLTALQINQHVEKTSMSSFERNPEKYGYTFDNRGWISNVNFTLDQATKLYDEYRLLFRSKIKTYAFSLLPHTYLGVSREQLLNDLLLADTMGPAEMVKRPDVFEMTSHAREALYQRHFDRLMDTGYS